MTDVQPLRGPSAVLLFGDHGEVGQLTQVHPAIINRLYGARRTLSWTARYRLAQLSEVPSSDGNQEGDPDKAAAAVLTALAAEKTPFRLLLGNDATDAIHAHLDAARAETLEWETVSRSTDFGDWGSWAAGPDCRAHVLDRRALDGPVHAATAPG